jgi:hypothetical protein
LVDPGSLFWDQKLIVELALMYARSGGDMGGMTTPAGKFARLVAIFWHVLPPENRCASEDALVQYIKLALPEIRSRLDETG